MPDIKNGATSELVYTLPVFPILTQLVGILQVQVSALTDPSWKLGLMTVNLTGELLQSFSFSIKGC